MKEKNAKKIPEKTGLKPKKRLGQNFLYEKGVIQKLVDAANIKPGETILEIGPGTGNLTAELLKKGNKLIAVEKDPEMVKIIGEEFKADNIEIIEGDAMEFDEINIPASYKIAANLPFYLTSALIRKFLESANPPVSMTVIVQKEVAQRVCAIVPDMNLLAAAVQFYARPKIISYISKGCFWPAPKVDCAILQIELLPREGQITDAEPVRRFFKVMKAGFSHPRKQLGNNLAKELKIDRGEVDKWLMENGIEPSRRAETLTLDDWKKLASERFLSGI